MLAKKSTSLDSITVQALQPNEIIVKPIVLDQALDNIEHALNLLRRGGPYQLWAAINDHHETGKDLPWFQTVLCEHEKVLAPEFEKLFHSERFIQASRDVFGAELIIPSSLLINMNAPMLSEHPLIDSPLFRGAKNFHFDLLVAMGHSGLFHPWAVPVSSIICWLYDGLDTISSESKHIVGGEISRDALLLPNSKDHSWTIIDGDHNIQIAPEKMRISLLWKALVFKNKAARTEYEDGSNDLTLKQTLEIMSADLEARGIGKLDIDAGYEDANNQRLIHSTYSTPTLYDASRRKIS